MIEKTLRKAAVGTVLAGAMVLPAATTVAPSVSLAACGGPYENSIATSTDLKLSKPGGKVTATVKVSTGGETPNGRLRLKVTGQEKQVADIGPKRKVKFKIDGLRAKKNGKARTYEVKAKFFGACKFKDSSDQSAIVVSR